MAINITEIEERKNFKHYMRAKQRLEFWRNEYVNTMRDNNWQKLDINSVCNHNLFKDRISEIREYINESKKKITKFERLIK